MDTTPHFAELTPRVSSEPSDRHVGLPCRIGRWLIAAWRWLPEARPMMAADLASPPDGDRRLIVNGRLIVTRSD
ncbi:MAG: hypothetical protein AAF823_13485 [Planctomycetota bacterium]